MVERLKAAIEKARERRIHGPDDVPKPQPSTAAPQPLDGNAWSTLAEVKLDADRLDRNRVVTYRRSDPAHLAFDILRTRLLRMSMDNNWRRIGVTSATKGCGKTMVIANLAFSLARHPATWTIVIDLDLRRPNLAQTLGLSPDHRTGDFLTGRLSPGRFLMRVEEKVAVGISAGQEADPAETIQSAKAVEVLNDMIATFAPTIILYDLPPMLTGDDAIAALVHLDGVILVAAAGQTSAEHVRECERLLSNTVPLIGVILNKADEGDADSYSYDYESA